MNDCLFNLTPVGEVLFSNQDYSLIAFWPDHCYEIGDFLIVPFQKDEQKKYFLLTISSLQTVVPAHRTIMPLRLSSEEIQSRYPHLQELSFVQAQCFFLGSINQDLFIDPKIRSFPKLHSWAYFIEKKSLICEVSNPLEIGILIKRLNIDQHIKISIFESTMTMISNRSDINLFYEELFVLACDFFSQDLSKVQEFFKEINY